jgi:hypothetical protein
MVFYAKRQVPYSVIFSLVAIVLILHANNLSLLTASASSTQTMSVSLLSTIRGINFVDKAYSNGTHVWTGGLPPYVKNSTGQYVPFIMTQNSTHIIIDSKQVPLAMKKSDCTFTIFDNANLISQNPIILSGQQFYSIAVKLVGVTGWIEQAVKNIPCTYATTQNATGFYITTQRNQANWGNLTSVYAFPINGKPEVANWFKNMNPLWATNYKIDFVSNNKQMNLKALQINATQLTDFTSATGTGWNFTQNDLTLPTIKFFTTNSHIFFFDQDSEKSDIKNIIVIRNATGNVNIKILYGQNATVTPLGATVFQDPTWGFFSGTTGYIGNSAQVTSCGTAAAFFTSAGFYGNIKDVKNNNVATICVLPYGYFDLTNFPVHNAITDTKLQMSQEGTAHQLSPINCDYVQMAHQASTASATTVWNDVTGGTPMVSNDATCINYGTVDLGAQSAYFATELAQNEYDVGVPFTNMVKDSLAHADLTGNFQLQVTYTCTCPIAPTGLTTPTQSSTSIKPRWNAVTGATWYLVDRESPNGNGFAQITNTTQTSYTDSGLSAGTQYNYEIFAGNSTGQSPASTASSNYTSQIAPTSVTNGYIKDTTTRITWTNPTGNNTGGFKVEKATPHYNTFSTVISNTGNSTNHFDLTGLKGNTNYVIAVSSNYGVGTSQAGTSPRSANYSFYTLPSAPTNLQVDRYSASTLRLTWTAPNDNGTINGYKVEQSTDGGSTWSTLSANTGNSTTHYDPTGLSVALGYTYRVSTIQYSGTSSPSSNSATSFWKQVMFNVYENDGTTQLTGNVYQSNATSSNNKFPINSGSATVTGVSGLQNYTVQDGNTNLMVFKSYNQNASLALPTSLNSNVFAISCPHANDGTDFKEEMNETDGHRISTVTAVNCARTDVVTWNYTFTANGKSPLSYNSLMKLIIVSPDYKANPQSFTVNGTAVGTTYNATTSIVTSSPYVVGLGTKTYLLEYSMQMSFVPQTGGGPSNSGPSGPSGGGGGGSQSAVIVMTSIGNLTANRLFVTGNPTTITQAFFSITCVGTGSGLVSDVYLAQNPVGVQVPQINQIVTCSQPSATVLPVCPTGTSLINNQCNAALVCPSGTISSNGQCSGPLICPIGTTLSNNQCIGQPTCQNGSPPNNGQCQSGGTIPIIIPPIGSSCNTQNLLSCFNTTSASEPVVITVTLANGQKVQINTSITVSSNPSLTYVTLTIISVFLFGGIGGVLYRFYNTNAKKIKRYRSKGYEGTIDEFNKHLKKHKW